MQQNSSLACFLITHNSTFKMANARKTTIGASAYNAQGDNDKNIHNNINCAVEV